MSQHRSGREFELIDRMRASLAPASSRVHLGIGDDAAVVESPRTPLLLCSDAMVENTHFRIAWITPEELGHKALASCLSDIAAMNGTPLYALISLALRPGLPDDFVDRLYQGINTLARRYNVDVVGGDTAASASEIFIDVTLIGTSTHPATRRGARPGDLVVVSGTPGASRAGLAALQAGLRREEIAPALLRAHFRPEPRFDVLPFLQAPGVITSMIDISDGVASELHHLARGSGCGFEINKESLYLHPDALSLASRLQQNASDWFWTGGEDYELLITVDSQAWAQFQAVRPEISRLLHVIGHATPFTGGLVLRSSTEGRAEPIPDRGWTHFDSGPEGNQKPSLRSVQDR